MIVTPIAPLNKEEELELISLYKETGNDDAISKVIAGNIKFAYLIATKVIRQGNYNHSVEELVTEGCFGLVKAIKAFEPSNDVKLISYAGDAIYQAIYRYIKSENEDTDYISLQDPIDEDGHTLEDILEDESIPYDVNMVKSEQADFVNKLLLNLTEREKNIVTLYFWNQISFPEIAQTLNISSSRVQQMFHKAIRKLRYHGIKSNLLAMRNNILKLGNRYIDVSSGIKNRSI